MPLRSETTVYRTIGFSLSGTALFEFKCETAKDSKYICRLKAEFLASLIAQLAKQTISLHRAVEFPHKPFAQDIVTLQLFNLRTIIVYN